MVVQEGRAAGLGLEGPPGARPAMRGGKRDYRHPGRRAGDAAPGT